MRNVPKAVAKNGTARPWYVFSQPSESMVWRLTTSVASSGTSMVARKRMNSRLRPGNSSMANAYADSTDVTTWATVTSTDDDERVEQVAPEVALRPRLAQHVEREAVGNEGVDEDLVARLQGGDDHRVHGEQHEHRHDDEQAVAARRPASPPARSYIVVASPAIVHPPSDPGELQQRQHEHHDEEQDGCGACSPELLLMIDVCP